MIIEGSGKFVFHLVDCAFMGRNKNTQGKDERDVHKIISYFVARTGG